MAMGAGARGEGGGRWAVGGRWRMLLSLCLGRQTRKNSRGRQKAGSRVKQQRPCQEACRLGKRQEGEARE
jgi:hypothetical protein